MAALVEEEKTTALTGDFTFVFIPGDNYSPPQEVVKSLSGGLENDELQIFAKQHFSGVKLGEDTYMASVMNQLKAQGQDLSTLDPGRGSHRQFNFLYLHFTYVYIHFLLYVY